MITANNKFQIGQIVIYLDSDKKAHQSEVDVIFVNQFKNKQTIRYGIKKRPYTFYDENELFESKEELTNHIFQPDLIDFV